MSELPSWMVGPTWEEGPSCSLCDSGRRPFVDLPNMPTLGYPAPPLARRTRECPCGRLLAGPPPPSGHPNPNYWAKYDLDPEWLEVRDSKDGPIIDRILVRKGRYWWKEPTGSAAV
jgi:hypothetical protein